MNHYHRWEFAGSVTIRCSSCGLTLVPLRTTAYRTERAEFVRNGWIKLRAKKTTTDYLKEQNAVIVTYDSNVGRPFIRGTHNGNPRMWTVQVRVQGFPDVISFRPSDKVYISDLAGLIDRHLREEAVEHGVHVQRVRWTAVAR
ncbi:hypothetical protein D9M70_356250 [compost metagenome]